MTEQFDKLIMDVIGAIARAANLGVFGYVVIGILAVGLFAFSMWVKLQAAEVARRESERLSAKDQAKNPHVNQEISDAWGRAQEEIRKIREQNPSSSKKSRGPSNGLSE